MSETMRAQISGLDVVQQSANGTQQPIDRHAELLGELNTYRRIVEHNLQELFATTALLDNATAIKQAEADIHQVFLRMGCGLSC